MSPTTLNPDDIAFKELGSLQEKVVFFLAENPENHKQAIQKGIEHPNDQYGSVLKAVDAVEKLGYIEFQKTQSQKNVEIKVYKCTELGIFYALARNRSANIVKIFDSYETQVEFCRPFRTLYDVWGHDHFALFLRNLGEFLPMAQKNGVEQAVPYLLMKLVQQAQSVDPKTRKKNVKEVLKQFPKANQTLKDWRKNIDDVL
jgi:DNA-binding PadR family transcriptional regulator